MISDRQHDANRRNAEIILPTVEDRIDFEQFRFTFEEEYKPVGPTEEVLVEDIVVSRWRLNRIRKMEPGFFALNLHRRKSVREDLYSHDAFEDDAYGKMSRYEGRFERTFYKALKELQRLQTIRAAVSDSGNGTVSQSPVSEPTAPSASAGDFRRPATPMSSHNRPLRPKRPPREHKVTLFANHNLRHHASAWPTRPGDVN